MTVCNRCVKKQKDRKLIETHSKTAFCACQIKQTLTRLCTKHEKPLGKPAFWPCDQVAARVSRGDKHAGAHQNPRGTIAKRWL